MAAESGSPSFPGVWLFRCLGGKGWQGPPVKWFKKGQRASASGLAARRPAIAAGSLRSADTEARLENESQPGTQFTKEPREPRRHAPSAETISIPPSLGRYAVRRLLGTGGFGAVYLGHDDQLDRLVAIKVLRAGGARPFARHPGVRFP